MALLCRARRALAGGAGGAHLPFALALVAACAAWRAAHGPGWLSPDDAVFALLFALGLAAASAEHAKRLPRPAEPAGSCLVLALGAAAFVLFPTAYALLPALTLGAAFAGVVAGGTLFGLLASGPFRRLGDVSYGVYMVQGLVLSATYAVPPLRSWALSGPRGFWAVTALDTAAVVGLASLAHLALERPGIALGRRILRRCRGADRREAPGSRRRLTKSQPSA